MTDTQETKIIDADQIDLSGDGGVLKKILKEADSDEQPTHGCKVRLHYTGTLLDGTKFDSSLDRNDPFEFELGKGVVVKAFDIGVASMKQGEKSILTCAPEYAYGAAGSPPNIPPNSTLLFEIELLNWKPEDLSNKGDGSILRHLITKGISKKTPNDGAFVKVILVGNYKGRVFDNREMSFNLGEVPPEEVINGIQLALKHFNKGETSRLIIQPEFAFKYVKYPCFNMHSGAVVEYTVTLKDFEKQPDAWKLNQEESLTQAKLVKEKATAYLKMDRLDLAIKMYEKSNLYLSNCKDDESQKIKVAVFLNIAWCNLKNRYWESARKACDMVLEIEPNNVKALYRRGQSYMKNDDYELALVDFAKIHDLDPGNKAAMNQITICRYNIRQQGLKEKELYANMFAKFSDKGTTLEKEDDPIIHCGEWNMEEEARKEAEKAFEEVSQNVVML